MSGRPVLPIPLNPKQRAELERRARTGVATVREAERARIILCRADGMSQEETAMVLGCSEQRVARWSSRFRRKGLSGLNDKPGRGRKRRIDAAQPPAFSIQGKPSARPLGEPPAAPAAASLVEGVLPVEFSNANSQPRASATRQSGTPTLRSIAHSAGVSATTASRVIRGKPGVSPGVRRRVLAVARAQEYRPDPEIQKLMEHLRRHRRRRLQGTICALVSTGWAPGGDAYARRVIAGARRRADELGFAWDEMSISKMIESPRWTSRVLLNRGVEGILLPPTPKSGLELAPAEFWASFCVVSATFSIAVPNFHRVVPDQFRNMHTVCQILSEQGRRRIGLVLWRDRDERARHHYSGAFAAFHFERQRELLPFLFYDNADGDESLGLLREWFQRHKPDAIVVGGSWSARAMARRLDLPIPGPVAFAVASGLDFSVCGCGGVDEMPERIGAQASERLVRMILRGEKGIPEPPSVTMIEGRWYDPIDSAIFRGPSVIA